MGARGRPWERGPPARIIDGGRDARAPICDPARHRVSKKNRLAFTQRVAHILRRFHFNSAVSPPPPEPAPGVEQSRWFLEQVHPHEASLRFHLRSSFPTARDVDDVVQESYLRVWKARAAQPIQSAKAFLFKVARHVALDFVRRQRISPIVAVTDLVALPVIEDKPSAADVACTRDEVVLLAQAIDSLPPRCREIVILRKLRGVPQKAIAAQLGISEQTVQVQVLRGVKRCEAFLTKHGVRR